MTMDNTPAHRWSTRREILINGAACAVALGALGVKNTKAFGQTLVTETPSLEEGPYFVDEGIERVDVRSDPSTGVVQPGLIMTLAISVSKLLADETIAPLSGAKVDIWQANAYGIYSDEAVEGTVGQKFLRGYQVTNDHGSVRFLTIYPGWYSGRTAHIHVRVRVYSPTTAALTYDFETQLFMDDTVTNDVYANVAPYNTRAFRDTTNTTDNVFTGASGDGSPAANAGQETLMRLYENRSRATASYNIVIDLTNLDNEAQAGGGTGGPPGGGTPPGGGGTPPGGGGMPPAGGGGPGSGTPPSGPPPG